jgi:nucleoside-diphosphate-sugar epimerase
VVGAGYLGATVARQAKAGGWEVIPVVRSEGSAESLRNEFPDVQAANATEDSFWNNLQGNWRGVIWALSPSRGYEGSFLDLHRKGAVLAAAWARRNAVAMVYVSSTSVYAEAGGGWVDETSPVAAEDDRSMAMVKAERATLDSNGVVLRCAGIYGPGRDLRTGSEGPERWLNVVQVQDAARAVGLVLGRKGGVYNVCENEPLRRGIPDSHWPAGRRERRNKRVSNAKIRGLGWQPLWKACRPDTI